jgi:nicotinamidase-related amidase
MNQLTPTALVIIDHQRGILRGLGGLRQPEHDAALDATTNRIAGLLKKARHAGVPVLFVQHDGAIGHRLEPGTEAWELREEITPLSSEPVIRKRACDSFFETGLEAELHRLNAGRIVVAGCMTQYCVDTTVRRAVSLGYDVVLASDGHMTADSGGLRFEQIIAHHNTLLNGFDAGDHAVAVVKASEIEFLTR